MVEHAGAYDLAVAAGRDAAAADPKAHFVDDEQSKVLLLGYSCAGQEVVDQLEAMGIRPTVESPLVVHMPCGVGGAPAGICLGLKHAFGDAVHVPFVSCCMSSFWGSA